MSYGAIVKELYWAAGFLEGEGSFPWRKKSNHHQLAIQASQVNPEPLYRLRHHWGGSVYGPITPKGSTRKPFFAWFLGGPKAAALDMMLYSLMSGVRQEQIKAGLIGWRTIALAPKHKTHCKRGHTLSDAYAMANGRRSCRQCSALRYQKKRDAQRNSLERTKDNVSLH